MEQNSRRINSIINNVLRINFYIYNYNYQLWPLQHNNSDFQCLAIIRNGIVLVRSDASATATITVYGEIFLYT